MRITILLLVILLVCSCSDTRMEFFENGNIKSYYEIKGNSLDGFYKEYYEQGELKESHIYSKDEKTDSSVYYNENGVKRKVIYWFKDGKNRVQYFDVFGEKTSEGRIMGEDEKFRIGEWTFKNRKNGIDSIVEYVTYNNKPYINQFWIRNKGENIPMRGNYYRLATSKDTVAINEPVKLQLFLYQPYLSYFDSDVSVILPENEGELAKDFSNLLEIETDTFKSLMNDGIPHPEIEDETLKKRIVAFGLVFEEAGIKRIRGALIEQLKSQNTDDNDSTNINERMQFFEKEIYVRGDTSNQ